MLSCLYLHFVWKPGIRRQGDFKRYFRPKEKGEMNVINAFMLANLILINSGFSFYKQEPKLTSSRRGDSVRNMFIHTRKSEGPLRTRHPSRIVFAHIYMCLLVWGIF